jgi:uncharacterized protein (UPF0332 family)
LIDLEECISKGLVKKTVPSMEQAIVSISKSKALLVEAKGDLEDERYNSATVVAYLVLLNCSRALLFKDGYRERSHACVARYLEVKYKNKIPQDFIMLLDHYRETRHDVQYEPDFSAEADGARQIVEFSDKFLKLVENLMK